MDLETSDVAKVEMVLIQTGDAMVRGGKITRDQEYAARRAYMNVLLSTPKSENKYSMSEALGKFNRAALVSPTITKVIYTNPGLRASQIHEKVIALRESGVSPSLESVRTFIHNHLIGKKGLVVSRDGRYFPTPIG